MNFRVKGYVLFFVFLLLFSCDLEDFNVDSDDPRDDIVDVWNCEEKNNEGTQNYVSAISKHATDSTKIIIEYIYGLGTNAKAEATYRNRSITIPQQSVKNITIKGNGNVTSDYSKIELYYTADDGSGELDNVIATYSR